MFDLIKRAMHNWRERQQTWDELSRLSDAELADIGIMRADIPRIVRGVHTER